MRAAVFCLIIMFASIYCYFGFRLSPCLLPDAVRRNWHSAERVEKTGVRTAICECLKHASQREARRLSKAAKTAVSIPAADEDLEAEN